jgi:hypothetical protein
MAEDACSTVIRALHVLLHNADAQAKREADEWLHRFQRTPEAWQVRACRARALPLPRLRTPDLLPRGSSARASSCFQR